ncbi:alpha/beta hydrolase [Hungatella hathewayi]
MAYLTFDFESQYLHGNTRIGIILPNRRAGMEAARFYDQEKKFKVLWLLHGTTGDYSDWTRYSMIEVYADENDLAVVMPSTHNASYTNWHGFGMGYEAYDYLFYELMPLIYNWFPISDRREDNFIAGDSMGGLGALEYALTEPEKFAGAAVLAACPHHYEYELTTPKGKNNKRYQNLFENAGGYEKFMDSRDNVWRLFEERVGRIDLPSLYFAEGTEDRFGDFFNHFVEFVERKKINVKIEKIQGYDHEWRFWNRAIQRAMKLWGFDTREDSNAY